MTTTVKPLIFGYHSARRALSDEHLMSVRTKLTTFASDEGYSLAGIFSEMADQPAAALETLVESAERRDVATVAVPSIADLGGDAEIQRATRKRLEEAGIRVLVLVGGAS